VSGHEHGFAGTADECREVFDFTLDRVRVGVCALAAAATVEVVDREVSRQLGR
jgi:hypothetical protein